MITRNERGSVIIVAVLVLALLSIIGVSSVRTSITEQQIATNMVIHKMNFYGAESALAHGMLWANANILPTTDASFEPDDEVLWVEGELTNLVAYTGDIEYIDPGTAYEVVSKMPDIRITGEGTHTGRGGLSVVQATYGFKPAFPVPEAPIWVWDELALKSSAVEINPDYNVCDGESEGPEAISTLGPPPIGGILTPHNESKNCPSGGCQIEKAKGTIDIVDMRSNLSKLATYMGTEMPVDLGTAAEPVVVYIDASTPISINGGEGHGILFIDGDVEKINGDFDWNGLVVINGGILSKINGNTTITGALIIDKPDLDVELTGNVTINYDCELLEDIYNKFSGYRMTSWRQM